MQRRNFLRLSSLAAAATTVPGCATIPSAGPAPATSGTQRIPHVPRWEPHDFSFTSHAASDNPFTTEFSADVTGPNGISFTIPGFYDGQAAWKVRVSPTAPGQWSLVTRSADPSLGGLRAAFTCIANPNPAIHGGLRVDPAHPSQFLHEDGARFFPMGYECDWLWALDSFDPALKTLNPFLDRIAGDGFNFIILNAFAYDTTWRKGRTGDDDYGPPPLYAWEGANDKPAHSRFNLAFWQHYDRMMHALYTRGIVAHILLRVYNKQVNWPANGSPEDDMYYRWILARYAAYPNVAWDIAKEAQYEKSLDYKLGRLRYFRNSDPYHRLLTVHDDRANYDSGVYNHLADFRSDQQHTEWRKVMLAHLQQYPWPVINTEFGYECGPNGVADKTYNVAQLPEEVARRAWEVCTAGGFAAYYYTYTAWDVIRPRDTPPGYAWFRNLQHFFSRTGYWKMKPLEGVAGDGFCLADPGREYIFFLNTAAPFALSLDGLHAPLKAEWYHPFTAARIPGPSVGNGESRLTPPEQWGRSPVALHLL